jgi:hypothetical protein
MPNGPKIKGIAEEAILRSISKTGHQVTVAEAQHDVDATTADDYDDWFLRALRERETETISPGYGGIQHPTARLFEIGIDSIRAGKPSELFLTLLEQIRTIAEERDVMALLFPETFPRRIKKTTVRAAQRDAQLVEQFKEHLREYLLRPKTPKVSGNEEKGGSWGRIDKTFAEAMEDFKRTLSTDKRKALDRALQSQGAMIIEWRDELARVRKANKGP